MERTVNLQYPAEATDPGDESMYRAIARAASPALVNIWCTLRDEVLQTVFILSVDNTRATECEVTCHLRE